MGNDGRGFEDDFMIVTTLYMCRARRPDLNESNILGTNERAWGQ